MDVVSATALTKRYDKLTAVDHLELTIGQGDVVAILGPNGAGKSTTIEMLLGLRTPTSGEVKIFGAAPNSTFSRARVGAMLQDSQAPEVLSVEETIDHVRNSETQLMFRGFLFQRIVPVLRDIGLFGDRIRAAFEDMGVLGFADTDLDALVAEDDAIAEEFDRMRHVEAVADET